MERFDRKLFEAIEMLTDPNARKILEAVENGHKTIDTLKTYTGMDNFLVGSYLGRLSTLGILKREVIGKSDGAIVMYSYELDDRRIREYKERGRKFLEDLKRKFEESARKFKA